MGVTKKAKGSKPGAEPARCEKCYRKPPDVILSNRRDLMICTRCLQREKNHAIIKNLEELSDGKVTLTKRRRELLSQAGRILAAVLPGDFVRYGFDRFGDVNARNESFSSDDFPTILKRAAERLSRSRERELAKQVRAMIAWYILAGKPRKGRPSYGLAPIPFWRISLAGIAQSRDYLTGSWFRVGIPEGTETKPGGLLIIPCPCCAAIDAEAEARPVLLSHAGEWTGRWDGPPNGKYWPSPPVAQYWTAYLGQCNACSAILWGVTEPTEARPKANSPAKP
jgi:hypothetical protein